MSRAARRRAQHKAKKAAPKVQDSPSQIDAARHEAAHATVGVRLGLPLAYTDIKRRSMDESKGYQSTQPGVAHFGTEGYTTLVEGAAEGWCEALPDPDARECLERFAAHAAAGVVAEIAAGRDLDDPSHSGDIEGIVHVAAVLGIGTSTDDPAVRDFMVAAYNRAREVLLQDDSAGWDLVTDALLKREKLTGDDVRVLLEEAVEAYREGSTDER